MMQKRRVENRVLLPVAQDKTMNLSSKIIVKICVHYRATEHLQAVGVTFHRKKNEECICIYMHGQASRLNR